MIPRRRRKSARLEPKKAEIDDHLARDSATLKEQASLYRALRCPMLPGGRAKYCASALQKTLARGKSRHAACRNKHHKQGIAVLDAVWRATRYYPLDNAFYNELPEPLQPHSERCDAQKPERE